MDVVSWLMEGDPAIRWQVMRDLLDVPPAAVVEERGRVAREGWGKRVLDLQADDGQWGGGAYSPKWISTTYTLLLLRHYGIDPADPSVSGAIEKVRRGVVMAGGPFFQYHREMCVTAMVLALSSYFGAEEDPGLYQLDWILEAQRSDGGWNCETSSERSSFHTTISVLEALLEYERAMGGNEATEAARARAHDYLLQRSLFRSRSTGEVINPRWRLFSFPPRWHYDVLRGLDYLTDAGVQLDSRLDEALDLLESKRDKSGRWPVQNRHAGKEHFSMEKTGSPSWWNTWRALRVLKWFRPSP